MKFKENWPSGFRGEVVQRCGWMDYGQHVITIAHSEPLAQVT